MNADRQIFIFPIQLTKCKIGNLTRLIHTLAICVTIHTYIRYIHMLNGETYITWHDLVLIDVRLNSALYAQYGDTGRRQSYELFVRPAPTEKQTLHPSTVHNLRQ